ncbi:MAG TPA: glycosyltransferase family 4 protein [Candidatus Nanoarchaeia archaeon]|nr:glycosyltransferase family 4 protein [Candidatus Nanoarchaeia archaeon]
MKILFICENYYPHRGGAEVLFKKLAEGYVQRGHQVTILTHRLKNTPKKENVNGVVIRRVHSFFSRYLFTFSSVREAVKLAKKHDIIQTTTFNGAPPAWLAGKIARKPVVLTVHEVWLGRWKEITGFSWLKSKLHELLERSIYLLPYEQYICVSEATKKDLLRLPVKEEQVRRVYNGLDYTFWDQKIVDKRRVADLRKQLGLESKFVYFSWGRPGESKGFEYLIKAIPLVIKEIPDAIFLLMFGSAAQYKKKHQQLLDSITLLNLPNHIKVLPSVSDEKNRDYLALADCLVVPSLSEGFGYNAVQAAAMERPVVVSNAGALPEVVWGRYQVFQKKDSVDLAKKMVQIYNKTFLKQEKKSFSWEECISNYLQVYQEQLSRRGAHPLVNLRHNEVQHS